ncbi:MAG: hypothetical protein WAQ05_03880 [Rubrivivax sp.]
MNPSSLQPEISPPWWRVGMVWLVVGGPLAVVVAGIATAVIAVRGADPVISNVAPPPKAGQVQTETPAMQARNHAATASGR